MQNVLTFFFFFHSLDLFLGVPSFGACAQSQTCRAAADPDLGGGGGGRGGHPDPDKSGGGGLKKIFRPFGPQFALKIREAPPFPPGPSSGFATLETYKLAPRGRVRETFWRRSRLRERKSDCSSHRHCCLALLTVLPRTRTSEPARRFPLSSRRSTTTSAKCPRGNTIEGHIE